MQWKGACFSFAKVQQKFRRWREFICHSWPADFLRNATQFHSEVHPCPSPRFSAVRSINRRSAPATVLISRAFASWGRICSPEIYPPRNRILPVCRQRSLDPPPPQARLLTPRRDLRPVPLHSLLTGSAATCRRATCQRRKKIFLRFSRIFRVGEEYRLMCPTNLAEAATRVARIRWCRI
jgi:hypothetical protein